MFYFENTLVASGEEDDSFSKDAGDGGSGYDFSIVYFEYNTRSRFWLLMHSGL